MKKTLPKGDTHRAMTLQGLRAGPMTSMEMTERWSFGARYAVDMQREGLVESVGDEYRITEAGRAACPFRNPLAATAAAPETFIMPKGETKLTRQQVLAAIVAAGPAGMSRAALIEKFAHLVSVQSIEMHMSALYRQKPPVVFKPKPGVLVAVEFMTYAPAAEPAVNDPLPVAADDDLNNWVPEPLATDIEGVSLAVDHHDAAELTTADLARQMALIDGLGASVPAPAVVEDFYIDDPDQTEFAIYSSGGMDIMSGETIITLKKPVLAKLRAFLGLFAEAA